MGAWTGLRSNVGQAGGKTGGNPVLAHLRKANPVEPAEMSGGRTGPAAVSIVGRTFRPAEHSRCMVDDTTSI
jgi:hypothetical protein